MTEAAPNELDLDTAIEQQTANVQRAIGYLNAFQWLKQQGYRVVPASYLPPTNDPPNQPEGTHAQAQAHEAPDQ